MCAINFNTISGYHIDRDDDKYGFCWLVPLGEWEGGDLIFPQLNVRIKLKPGNILAFRSNLLVHGNLPCSGVRHSLVFFTHNNLFPETFVHVENNNSNKSSNQKKRKTNVSDDTKKKKKK
jgi:hypothetical protein